MAFKLIVQNSKIVLKSVANYIINATGIKDLFTGDSSIDSNGKINWTLQHYVNTAANFTSANPTLLVGQIGIETDGLLTTPKFKIGNGVTAWNSLPYFSSGSGSTPSLQDVTDVGSTTTNAIDANGFNSKDVSNVINSYIDSTGIYVFNSSFSGSNLLEVDRVNDIIRYLGVQVATVNDVVNVDVNTIGTAVNGAASATPNDTDLVMSVDTSVAKKNTWTQIKSFLKTYFDTLYTLKSNNLSDLTNVNTARNNLKEWDLRITTGNQTTTSNVAINITDLVTPTLAANKLYDIEGHIYSGCNNTGGVKFQITIPTGATIAACFDGSIGSNSTFQSSLVLASATLTGFSFIQFNGSNIIKVKGQVLLGGTAGTIQFGFASATNTQTSTIYQLGTHITVKQLD